MSVESLSTRPKHESSSIGPSRSQENKDSKQFSKRMKVLRIERARFCCSFEGFDKSGQCPRRARENLSKDQEPMMTRDRKCRCLIRSRNTTIDDRR